MTPRLCTVFIQFIHRLIHRIQVRVRRTDVEMASGCSLREFSYYGVLINI
jgi:hypothetical protein